MLDINLLPQKDRAGVGSKDLQTWVMIGGVAVVLGGISASFGLLSVWKNNRVDNAATDLAAVEGELAQYADVETQANQLQGQIVAVEDMLGQHIRWSNFFALVETLTKSDIEFLTVSGAPGGIISLTGRASNYDIVAQQIRSFEESADIEKVTLSQAEQELNVNTEEEEINFVMSIVVSDDLFYVVE